ncbi:MAG TPA: patatin-like phospholipase family protein [Gemmatimonadaceae bacterium]|nr:patatin-like phospholipase family protein [Gemmatimonadaceae bacterium]
MSPATTHTKTVLPERLALVLGGGGLKGFAHIGLLRALEERGIRPALVAGSSIGALIAAAYATGMSVDDMERRALALTKKDLFRIDRLHMVTKRMLSPSLYLAGPLDALVRDIVPPVTFRALKTPLLVSTVDLERGAQMVWGLPGLMDVSVADAVYASCALPGFFPPRVIDGRTCADGGVMDNLPDEIAVRGMDAVIGVDVGSSSLATARRIKDKGFAAIYMRAAQIMMKSLQVSQLATWAGPPLLLVRPPVWHYNWFSFASTRRMLDAGYAAAHDALDRAGDALWSAGGVYPRRTIALSVVREKCIGCTLCVTLAPDTMAMDAENKAYVMESPLEWSRADGDFIHQCPTDAIKVEVIDGNVRTVTMERKIEPE